MVLTLKTEIVRRPHLCVIADFCKRNRGLSRIVAWEYIKCRAIAGGEMSIWALGFALVRVVWRANV